MKYFVIFCLIVAAKTSENKCTTGEECYRLAKFPVRYYCYTSTKTCYYRRIMAPSPIDKACDVHQDCFRDVPGVKFYCDYFTKKCFWRQILVPQPTDHHCEKREDCYSELAGVELYCDNKTKTCATRSIA